ncbi:Family transcriptional regulator protein [Lasiodiplodia theobromae]|uniref:Family transcriptional regulator protein n=1 Tax=Lasiodiplodia theobromae TaxID=45133 RepID=UPI0015C407FE|nr:Family transcriptional regulator protein [Lasiodiplodia theobromae]KAF4539863.1 Family transcriptional regulator protein [Lasiodiplodia theobromae]
MSNLITVFGATGNQGGSVIQAILADPTLSKEFKLRGITRDASKPAAQALQAKGVEMVSASMEDPASLNAAVKGSHTVFLVTTPAWGARASPDAELIDGKNVADACKDAGVQHLIFSSLLHATKETGGRLKHIPHFDHKAEVEEYIRAIGVPATFVLPGYFMGNYTAMGMIRKNEEGVYTLAYPVGEDARFPLIDISEDMGKYVVASIKQRSKLLGAQVLAAADYYTPTRILNEFEDVTGQKTQYVQVDPQTYKSFLPIPEAIAQELLENHLFIGEPGYYAGKDLKPSLDLLAEVGLKPTTFREFLEKNKAAFA